MRIDIRSLYLDEMEHHPLCECGSDATMLVGRTTSEGFDVETMCKTCCDAERSRWEAWKSAEDVEERLAPEGRVFLVTNKTNDCVYNWTRTFKSYRKAVAFFRMIGLTAEAHGGLHSADSVQEVSKEEGIKHVFAASAVS